MELVDEQKIRIPKAMLKVAITMLRRSVKKRAGFSIDDVAPVDHVDESFIPALFGALFFWRDCVMEGWCDGGAVCDGYVTEYVLTIYMRTPPPHTQQHTGSMIHSSSCTTASACMRHMLGKRS